MAMTHEEWMEAAGHLASVTWHLQMAGIAELAERMNTARSLLEDQRNPAAAARKLMEIEAILRRDTALAARLAHYEQFRSRPPDVLGRLAQLATEWSAHRSIRRGVTAKLPATVGVGLGDKPPFHAAR